MDIFEKCFAPSLAGELKEKGVYPYFHALQSRQDVEVQMEGKRRIMLGSNNYLGLTTDPEVIEAGIRALEQYGTLKGMALPLFNFPCGLLLCLPDENASKENGCGMWAGKRLRHQIFLLLNHCTAIPDPLIRHVLL